MIVVVGVFLGIQVSNWNEARVDREREVVYLQRMAQDFVTIDDRIQRGLKVADVSMKGCLVALLAINISNGEQQGELPAADVLLYAVQNCGDPFTGKDTGTRAVILSNCYR